VDVLSLAMPGKEHHHEIVREEKHEVFYVLISAKVATPGD
jgi:hypothetical protein